MLAFIYYQFTSLVEIPRTVERWLAQAGEVLRSSHTLCPAARLFFYTGPPPHTGATLARTSRGARPSAIRGPCDSL